mgnify:CR=1 FL=1
MKKRLVFATNNAHKLEEIRAILGNSIEILSLADIHCHADIPETADTLEGNARQKSRYVYEHYGLDCFADDTGLEVEALDGAPGSIPPAMQAAKDTTPKPICSNCFTNWKAKKIAKHNSVLPFR